MVHFYFALWCISGLHLTKNKKEFMKDLKKVYQAVFKQEAELELDRLEEKWGNKYPIVIKSWRNKWDNLSNYFRAHQLNCVNHKLE